MKTIKIAIALLGFLSVLLGAFGAHTLQEHVSSAALHSFETAVRYQFLHVLVLLFIQSYTSFSTQQKTRLSALFLIGVFFFSGSIYAIVLVNFPAKFMWFLTPLGGLILLVAWLQMAWYFFKRNEQ